MNAAQDFLVILQQVSSWPGEDRLRLAQAILNTLIPHPNDAPRGVPAAQMLGLAGKQAVPDDATIDQWIDERRREKYG